MISFACQRENWQRQVSCLPNMMKLQSLLVCVSMNEWTAYSGLIVSKYETFIALSHKFRNSYARVASTTFIK